MATPEEWKSGRCLRYHQSSRQVRMELHPDCRQVLWICCKEISEETMPIILDEAFAYYDEKRLENILKYLKIKQRENSDCINIKNMVVGRRLKNIICGGSIIRQGLRKELYDFGIELIKGYGITECSPVISIEAWNEDEDDLTVGIPLKCNTVKVVDHEILVKGDNVTRGYYLNQNE